MPAPLPPAALRTVIVSLLLSASALGDEEEPGDWETEAQVELGASYNTGNSEDENIRVRSRFDAERGVWGYRLNFDGFRSSTRDELSAERFYAYGTTTHNYDEDNFSRVRLAHEHDRFSGFERQTDVSVSYGQIWLRSRDDMEIDYTVGVGARSSKSSDDDINEAIIRLSSLYTWEITDNSRFSQEISTDAGDSVVVSRSETGVESDILNNLSMKFTIRLRHQNNVPSDRKRLDTETALTLLFRF